MNITLKWDGPVGPKNFPEAFLEKESLTVSGVYLRFKQYENRRIVSYVGHSVNLLSRFDQHLRDILTFSVTLRDDFGEVLLSRNGSDRAAVYNRLDTLIPCIEKELSRTQFLFARCGDDFGEGATPRRFVGGGSHTMEPVRQDRGGQQCNPKGNSSFAKISWQEHIQT